MVTRAKAGVFKPKVLTVELPEFEPRRIVEAFAHGEWKKATQTEYDALIQNDTWELVSLPPGRKAIGYKWLFKVKQNSDGTIARHKGRLVAKGCSQVQVVIFEKPSVWLLSWLLFVLFCLLLCPTGGRYGKLMFSQW